VGLHEPIINHTRVTEGTKPLRAVRNRWGASLFASFPLTKVLGHLTCGEIGEVCAKHDRQKKGDPCVIASRLRGVFSNQGEEKAFIGMSK